MFVEFFSFKLQETGDDYGTHDEHLQHIAQEDDLYDDVITTQSSEADFSDIAHISNQNIAKIDHSNGSGIMGNSLSNSYGGRRVSLYVGQLTWVCDKNISGIVSILFLFIVDN